MPAKNPRITITITPELHKALKELSEVSGASASSFVTQLLIESIPVIQWTTQALKQAKTDQGQAFETLQDIMLQAQLQASQLNLEISEATKLHRAKGTVQEEGKRNCWNEGWEARDHGQPRTPPADLNRFQKGAWCAGWDASDKDHKLAQLATEGATNGHD